MRKLLFFLLITACVDAKGQTSIDKDIKTGSAIAKKVESQIGLVHVLPAEAQIKKTGDRLVSQLTSNPYTFSFQIIDQPEPNAFALPGGFIYVSRGLLALLKSEDELAGVLGHEISHVVQRHSAKSQRKSILPSIIAVPGVVLGGTLGGELGDKIAAPFLGAGKIYLASFSRKQEAEADNLGIELAAKAGYQPMQLSSILSRMEKVIEAESGKSAKFSFFGDHPMTPDRMKAIREKSATLSVAASSSTQSSWDFLKSFDHIPYGPNPAHGIFNQNIFLHPGLKIYMEFPKAWTYLNESSMAGGYSEGQKDIAIIMREGRDRQLDTLIENFVNGYYAKTRQQPQSDKQIKMIGREGSEVILPRPNSNDILYTLWFRKDGSTFAIFATGHASKLSLYREIGLSFRDLMPDDFPLIFGEELMTVKAGKNETMKEISTRSYNALNPRLAELINDVSESKTLPEGVPIRITIRKIYRNRP